jgi:hypothetical protein
VEDLVSEQKRVNTSEVIKDAQLLIGIYDKNGDRRITMQEFRDQLTPKQV